MSKDCLKRLVEIESLIPYNCLVCVHASSRSPHALDFLEVVNKDLEIHPEHDNIFRSKRDAEARESDVWNHTALEELQRGIQRAIAKAISLEPNGKPKDIRFFPELAAVRQIWLGRRSDVTLFFAEKKPCRPPNIRAERIAVHKFEVRWGFFENLAVGSSGIETWEIQVSSYNFDSAEGRRAGTKIRRRLKAKKARDLPDGEQDEGGQSMSNMSKGTTSASSTGKNSALRKISSQGNSFGASTSSSKENSEAVPRFSQTARSRIILGENYGLIMGSRNVDFRKPQEEFLNWDLDISSTKKKPPKTNDPNDPPLGLAGIETTDDGLPVRTVVFQKSDIVSWIRTFTVSRLRAGKVYYVKVRGITPAWCTEWSEDLKVMTKPERYGRATSPEFFPPAEIEVVKKSLSVLTTSERRIGATSLHGGIDGTPLDEGSGPRNSNSRKGASNSSRGVVFNPVNRSRASTRTGATADSTGRVNPIPRTAGSASGSGRSKDPRVDALIDDALGPLNETETKKALLQARNFQTGRDFVHSLNKFSRPRDERETRMQRMRLCIAQQQAGYRTEYLKENSWAQGPFFYDEVGRKHYEKVFPE